MNQPELINTRPLATTREHARRARERATPAAAPVSSKTRWLAHFQETEFSLPDECRKWPLSKIEHCPQCGFWDPKLVRAGDYLDQWYRVECRNEHCRHTTPPMKSSTDAIRLWRVEAALLKR